MDKVNKEKRSATMRAVKSKGSKIELMVRKELWKRGLRFRVNTKTLFGKPDISIKKLKLVIFIDSCFWHGCPYHARMPKSNVDFWRNKIERNIERDKEVTNHYKKRGWSIIRVWEHSLKDDFKGTVDRIHKEIVKLKKEKENKSD
ncbi:very short patch repair endonuclease [Bacillus haynesii]|uniref:very short patch repair endonuclease n=1 Tax=Bacillus TaxID=1386 RepID=UPI0022814C3F|nr:MULTISPECIES: very short patch repair endonuclease [Bacillus]MCY7858140.1 very short patch repair endonuclease [Bacillus sonorensis]MCY8088412.1 very short patch repair endonuclease [Bacillus sonorensis]MCY8268726.1 very short patch repair endonuclease [Bacillus haynesii]MCY8354920.1 very short patch repair endonuclease [Bacillus haynesii]MCY8553924.1 very short patch repair endonuclease [Bacillus haynesii]